MNLLQCIASYYVTRTYQLHCGVYIKGSVSMRHLLKVEGVYAY